MKSLPCLKKYILIFLLLNSFSSFSQKTKRSYKTFKDSVYKVGDRILSPEIRWDLGRSGLMPESKDSILIIAKWLKKHTNFRIEIGCHTDTRGKAEANMTLSTARAQSIVDYMVKGLNMSADQIVAKGYGKTDPIYSDDEISRAKTKYDKEPLHQRNRRTEIKILLITKKMGDSIFNVGDIIPIHFEYGGGCLCRLLPEYRDSAKAIANFLEKHPSFKIEIASFTDSRGNPKGNELISQSRSQSIVDYLVKELGLSKNNMSAKGYGGAEPLVSDSQIKNAGTPEEKEVLYQKNRRTVVKILKIE